MENNHQANLGNWVDARLAALEHQTAWQPDAAHALKRLHAQQATLRAATRTWAWAAACATLACTGLLAFPVTRAFAARCVDACVASTGRVSHLLWNVRTPSSERLPSGDFTLPDASGQSIHLAAQKGKVVVLNFWATWCAPCNAEIPWFVDFQVKYREHQLAVLGVSLDEDGWTSVRPYIEAKRINYPIMIGTDEIAARFGGVDSLPTTLILDKAGRVAFAHTGLVSRTEYESEIQTLLKE